MKKVNLENKVLDEVVRFEKKRTFAWLIRSTIFLIGLAAAIGVVAVLAIQIILDRGTLDLLQLLGEDNEIVKEFWRDTLATFIAELPQQDLIIIGVLLFVLILFIIFSRKSFKLVQKKRKKISEYEKQK